MSGYFVRFEALRRRAKAYDQLAHDAEEVRADLRAAFDRDRNTLGHDMYGAELAKKLPAIESGIFDALKTHIDELQGVASGLNVNARTYEGTEPPSVERS
ncbi:hypothetical protein [Nonomuraea sp. NPDC005501]|uniref:hypothetical protein n=1 Tax=Nonomuraea sp. NPDC005501 TaxID=3156884 RepID=UPI00339F4DEB